MTKSYIKEAERNVLNQARYYSDAMEFFRGMAANLSNCTHDYAGQKEIREGIDLVMRGLYKEQQFALSRCFALVGVGGKEAEKFSRENAQRLFGGDFANMQWLNEWRHLPGHWMVDDEKKFTAELKEALK